MKNKKGSSLLMVLFVVSALTILITMVWRNTTLALDMALQRVAYEQQLRLAEGVLNYGVLYAKIHYDQLIESEEEEHVITLDRWPSKIAALYVTKVILKSASEPISIIAQLYKDNNLVLIVSCQCKQKTLDDGTISTSIVDWHLDNEIDEKN
ncbi:MAG: hypothetical protein NTX86_01695 [Candidatus Dependentiae bacterium]|nr:hypothetical protein [Candidatus Dependentiae bacterium]